MAPTFSSDLLRSLRPRRDERRAIGAIVGVLVAEALAVALMLGVSHRFDTAFLDAEHCLRLAAIARTPMAPGDTLVLAAGAPQPVALDLDGDWSALDPRGIWTDGTRAGLTVALRPPADGRPIALRFEGNVMPDRQGVQPIAVSVDGVVVNDRSWPEGPAALVAPITRPSNERERLVHVTFRIGEPTRPSSADPRTLGFHLERVVVASEPIAARP